MQIMHYHSWAADGVSRARFSTACVECVCAGSLPQWERERAPSAGTDVCEVSIPPAPSGLVSISPQPGPSPSYSITASRQTGRATVTAVLAGEEEDGGREGGRRKKGDFQCALQSHRQLCCVWQESAAQLLETPCAPVVPWEPTSRWTRTPWISVEQLH